MPLRDRPEFQAWLQRYETLHVALHGVEPRADRCDGCGDPVDQPLSGAGLCMVCLAEIYGLERGQASGRIAGIMEAALVRSPGVLTTDVRGAVEDVLERYGRASGEPTG